MDEKYKRIFDVLKGKFSVFIYYVVLIIAAFLILDKKPSEEQPSSEDKKEEQVQDEIEVEKVSYDTPLNKEILNSFLEFNKNGNFITAYYLFDSSVTPDFKNEEEFQKGALEFGDIFTRNGKMKSYEIISFSDNVIRFTVSYVDNIQKTASITVSKDSIMTSPSSLVKKISN